MKRQIEIYDLYNSNAIYDFVNFICDHFQINPKCLTLCSMDEKLRNEEKIFGACIDEDIDNFIILVYQGNRRIEEVFNTIAHEMIHVKQFIKENLNEWMYVDADVPYEKRWWEIEANTLSKDLVLKFVDFLKGSN